MNPVLGIFGEPLALAIFVAVLVASVASSQDESGDRAPPEKFQPQTVRCAVIGGLTDTGLWPELAERFEKETGHRAILASTGPKHTIADALMRGEADIVTMHACDTIINLVADGHGENPQPWLRNDLVLVGPENDPAGIRGEKDAATALKNIIAAKAKLLIHSSAGAGEVLRDVLDREGLELPAAQTISVPSERHRQMLRRAAEEKAYTLIGRIPFLAGKVDRDGLAIMVQGDPQLRRPYLVVTATAKNGTAKDDPLRRQAAQQLVEFLRSPATQKWIAEYGKERYDGKPLFFPVVPPAKP
jgi:tungstate transport system substrate-binding protein